MPGTATIRTFESFPASQTKVHTFMTGLRTVSWRNRQYFDPVNQSLVFEESTKLIKCPRIRASSFSLCSGLGIGSFSDASQIFNSNNAIRLFGTQNYGFADDMINMALKSFLPPRQPFQQLSASSATTACAPLGAFLEVCAKLRIFISNVAYFFARPFLVVRRNRYISTSKIYTNNIVGFNYFWCFIFDLYMNIVISVSMLTKLCRGWFSSFEFTNLVVARNDWNMFSTTYQGQTNRPVFLAKSKYPSIIISRCRFERLNWFVLLFGSFSISSDSSTSPNSQVSRQTVFLSNGLINLRLNCSLASYRWLNFFIGIVTSVPLTSQE